METSQNNKMKSLNSTQIKRICTSYMKNISVEVLSKKYKVSKRTIIRCLKINNIDVKKQLLLSTEEITNLCKLYLNNYSVKELSKKYKISKATVLTYLKTNNSYPRNLISSHIQYPILLKEFHSILNGNLKLTDLTLEKIY